MSSSIFEEEGKSPAAGGMATAQQQIEKQARQLAYDTRYQVKKEVGDKKVNPAAMKRLLLQRLQKSTAAPNVKMRAKQMLLGENYIGDVADFASNTVANALFKVFVEGTKNEVVEEVELAYLKELAENPDKKYKVRVTDKKTGNSYIRYATREKITQLRTNPNIKSVEMTEYGEPREGERKGGEDTAKATAGKGISSGSGEKYEKKYGKGGKNTVGDLDGDGTKEPDRHEYAGVKDNAIKKAIAKRKGVAEEFIADAAQGKDEKQITGKGVNNYAGKYPAVKIMPDDPTSEVTNTRVTPRSVYAHYEVEGEVIVEKAVSKAQQKFFGMVLAKKRGAKGMSPEVEKAAAGVSETEARKFAKTKHKGLPTHKEESECGMDAKPKLKKSEGAVDDVRSIPTKVNLVKNKLRAMGLKMSYEPEGEQIDEIAPLVAGGLALGGAALAGAAIKRAQDAAKSGVDAAKSGAKVRPTTGIAGAAYGLQKRKQETEKAMELLRQNYSPEGEIVDEERASERMGKGSPESSLSYPGRATQKQRGEMGGRHWQSGGEGGSRTERGKKKSDPKSQAQRLRSLSSYPEKSGKYAEMQKKKRGGDIGSRFD